MPLGVNTGVAHSSSALCADSRYQMADLWFNAVASAAASLLRACRLVSAGAGDANDRLALIVVSAIAFSIMRQCNLLSGSVIIC